MALKAMKQALRLTRAGQLDEAVRVIQGGLLGRKAPPAPAAAAAAKPVIELTPLPRSLPTPRAKPHKPPATRAAAPASASRFFECRHSGAAGGLDYWLFLPPDLRDGLPLVIMLHGCTQSPEDFARGTGMNDLAQQAGVIVAYPRQTQAANAQKCWNWFRPADQQRDGGEGALIAGIVQDVLRDHHADPARVYLAGLSAGGAAAANLAASHPDVFAAVAIHSGLVHGAARNLPGAMSAMRQGSPHTPGAASPFVPTITFHGDRDTTVYPVNSDQIIAAAAQAYGAPLTTQCEKGGEARKGGKGKAHRYTRAISRNAAGEAVLEQWTIAGAGHAWSGGNPAGSYTDPAGPDASQEMLRFFLQHRRA